ncbi:MAG: TRAP transporter small permease [Negativicutes bacterium]
MQILRQFNGVLLKLAGWTAMVALAAIAILIPYEVFGRYVISRMSTWTNEFCQYAVVWATMMGGAVGLKRGMHVGITSLTDSLPPSLCRWVQGIGYVCMMVFLSLMTYYGFDQTIMNINQTSSTVGISMSIPYVALPLGFLIMLSITVEQLVDFLTAGPVGRE